MSEPWAVLGVNAAEALEGVELSSGWVVGERVARSPNASGGNFSVNYWAEHPDGRKGFCKVLNYWWLLRAVAQGGDPLAAMAQATAVYQFERDLARECVNLSRVITAEDDGSFLLDGYIQPRVSYIIFEVAETDIRQILDTSDALDLAGKLRSLHHLATGVRQLHGRRVAHQDIKPSNTLVFRPDETGGRVTKVGDLGRATVAGRPASHDDLEMAGDPTYAPPEGLYHAVPVSFDQRRLACDVYQLGRETEPELNDGFEQGGWQVPYLDDDFGQLATGWIAAADAFLFGRRTYELFAGHWAQITDPQIPSRPG